MSKYITFEEMKPRKGRRTRMWRIIAIEHSVHLGFISWRSGWRRYVFLPAWETVFEQVCLRDIADFIEAQTKAHKEKKAS